MKQSESIKELATALAKFQGEVHNPNNTALNPFFKSKYSPLSEVLNTVRPFLSKYGLSIIQSNYGAGEGVTVTTQLMHTSGEWLMTGELTAKPEKNTAQAMGAIITYLRRYQLSGLLGISSEDDNDGNGTEQKKETKLKVEKTALEKLKELDNSKLEAVLNHYAVKLISELTPEQLEEINKKLR